MTLTCESCKYFSHLNNDCHRHPPNVFPLQQSGGQLGFIGVHPPTKSSGWCGEHESSLKVLDS